jgi:hypothetical protein
MTYQQYSDYIKLYRYLGKEPQGEFKEFYDAISALWEDMEMTVLNDYEPSSILFHKSKSYYMELCVDTGILWCDIPRVWELLEEAGVMCNEQIKNFIKEMFISHLDMNDHMSIFSEMDIEFRSLMAELFLKYHYREDNSKDDTQTIL